MPTSRRRPPLPLRTSNRAAALVEVEVVLGERECLLDAQPCAPQNDDHRPHAPAVPVIRRVAHHRPPASAAALPRPASP
jgi:hypothetical protein